MGAVAYPIPPGVDTEMVQGYRFAGLLLANQGKHAEAEHLLSESVRRAAASGWRGSTWGYARAWFAESASGTITTAVYDPSAPLDSPAAPVRTPPLDVLYEDNHLLAVNKPAALATMGAPDGKPTLLSIAKDYVKRKYAKPGNVYLGVMSRLDAPVTGVVLLAGWQTGISSIEVPVREAKQVLTGNGNASKVQLEASVRHRLKHQSPIRPYHAADAMGLALIGFYRYYENRQEGLRRLSHRVGRWWRAASGRHHAGTHHIG